MRGYAGKFLDIDLTSESIKEITFDEETLRKYIGGRGLATKILWDRLGDKWEDVDPLGPENIFLALTGPITGFYPGARICVSGKSPQSNGIVGSTVAGEFPIELKCAGYDGVIVSGKASKPCYIFIFDSEVEIRDASHLWGKDSKQTMKILTKELREEMEKRRANYGLWKEPAMIYIGPAGEKMCRVAAVCAKWTHASGYGGYGAVMGSKNLKAIVAKGTKALPEVADMEKVLKLIDEINKKIINEKGMFRTWGTGYAGYEVGAGRSSEPVRNWQDEWHDGKEFGVDKFERKVWIKRYWGDFGCPTTCLKIAMPKAGKWEGAITDNPDYELQAYNGTNYGVFEPEANVYLVSLIDDLGFCGIQAGNVIAFAAELYQRGILTKEDLNGVDLKWGNVEAFAEITKMIANREGIGDILAEGTYRAAIKIGKKKGYGKELLKYAVQVKGIGVGAHGTRSGLDYPLPMSYPCSVQGGDHTSVAYLPLEAQNGELARIFDDSAVYCIFNMFNVVDMDKLFEFLNAVTGFNITLDEWFKDISLRILTIQRMALMLGGPDVSWSFEDDDNPPRFYEPLPSGPKKGSTTSKEEMEKQRLEYFEKVGWDEKGIPKKETLKRLGIDDKNFWERIKT
jgi:aldehyde:ferredoxin oxidoreductase